MLFATIFAFFFAMPAIFHVIFMLLLLSMRIFAMALCCQVDVIIAGWHGATALRVIDIAMLRYVIRHTHIADMMPRALYDAPARIRCFAICCMMMLRADAYTLPLTIRHVICHAAIVCYAADAMPLTATDDMLMPYAIR